MQIQIKELKGADYFLTVFSAVRRKNKKMNNLLIILRIYLIFVAASGFIFGQIFLIILHGAQPLRECLA